MIVNTYAPDHLLKNHPTISPIRIPYSQEMVVWDRHEKRYYPKEVTK